MKQKNGKTWEPTERTQSLSKYLYRAPDPKYVIPVIFVFSLFFGLLTEMSIQGLGFGLFIFAFPGILSGFTSTQIVRLLNGKFYYRRSFLTSLIGILLMGFILLTGIIIKPIIEINKRLLVIYGYSIVFSMRYLVIRSTSLNSNRFSFLVSSGQSFFALVIHLLLFATELDIFPNNQVISNQEAAFGILSTLVLFISSLLFIEIVNSPLKTDIGINGTDLLSYFLTYTIEGTKEVESLFVPLQSEYNVPFSVLAFRKRKNMKKNQTEISENQKPFHAVIISPSVHPGPIGTVGGGNLPEKLSKPLSDLADHIIIPHGAATNDDNPATSKECTKIVKAVRKCLMGIEPSDFSTKISKPQVITRDTTMHLLRFGSKGIVISEPVPYPSDDLALSIFWDMKYIANSRDIDDIMLIDAHNNSKRGGNPVYLGDWTSVRMEEIFTRLTKKRTEEYELNVGFGKAKPEKELNGIGPEGVNSFILKYPDLTVGFIVVDGNNMLPEVRNTLIEEGEKLVDRCVVLTTDNHVVNATLGAYNPVGLNCQVEQILPTVVKSLEMALQDVGQCESALQSGEIEKINLLGYGNTNRLVATINSTISVLYRAAAACASLAFISSALVYLLV